MFTERLNKIMKIIGAKPTDIAGIIGCDRSAVDRVCKGSRVPQNGGQINLYGTSLSNSLLYRCTVISPLEGTLLAAYRSIIIILTVAAISGATRYLQAELALTFKSERSWRTAAMARAFAHHQN